MNETSSCELELRVSRPSGRDATACDEKEFWEALRDVHSLGATMSLVYGT